MQRAMFIVNPSSGKEKALEYKERVETILKNMDYDVTVKETEKQADATHFAKQACQEKYDFVIAMGGDGTINEVVNGLAEQTNRPKFTFIPLGTVNDFARALGISLDPDEAIEAIEHCESRHVDIAKINDAYFMNILAIGRIAESVSDVDVEQKTKFGPLAYVMEGMKALVGKEDASYTITHDQGTWKGEAMLVLVTLTNSVGGFEKLAPHAKLDDGLLHIFIIKNNGLVSLGRIMASIFAGNLEKDADVEHIRTCKAHIETEEPLTVNIDGDEGGQTPVNVEVLHQHLEVFAPKKP